MSETILVCGKCGRKEKKSEAWSWLNAPATEGPAGTMIIRCPSCITTHALRQAGGKLKHGVWTVGNSGYRVS